MSLASYQLLHSAMLGWQNQCEPNAESLLFAEAKPDFAGLFSKSAAKVHSFFDIRKFFAHFFIIIVISLVNHQIIRNFASYYK